MEPVPTWVWLGMGTFSTKIADLAHAQSSPIFSTKFCIDLAQPTHPSCISMPLSPKGAKQFRSAKKRSFGFFGWIYMAHFTFQPSTCCLLLGYQWSFEIHYHHHSLYPTSSELAHVFCLFMQHRLPNDHSHFDIGHLKLKNKTKIMTGMVSTSEILLFTTFRFIPERVAMRVLLFNWLWIILVVQDYEKRSYFLRLKVLFLVSF